MAGSKSGESVTINALEESFHEEKKTNLCSECGQEFKTRSGLRKHIIRHENEQKYECTECCKKFVEKHQYEGHMTKHGKEKLTCDRCRKTFSHLQSAVKRHLKICVSNESTSPGDNSVLKCDSCDLSFSRQDVLTDHVKRVHTNARRYVCTICGKYYKWRSSLHNHRKTKHTG